MVWGDDVEAVVQCKMLDKNLIKMHLVLPLMFSKKYDVIIMWNRASQVTNSVTDGRGGKLTLWRPMWR